MKLFNNNFIFKNITIHQINFNNICAEFNLLELKLLFSLLKLFFPNELYNSTVFIGFLVLIYIVLPLIVGFG